MPSNEDRIAAALIDFALGLQRDAVPEAVARGMDEPFAGALRTGGGGGSHHVLGRTDAWPMRDAAFLNGMLIHAIKFDGTHMEAVLHPTATALPAAMAAAEHVGASDDDLLAAYVAAVEISTRVGPPRAA